MSKFMSYFMSYSGGRSRSGERTSGMRELPTRAFRDLRYGSRRPTATALFTAECALSCGGSRSGERTSGMEDLPTQSFQDLRYGCQHPIATALFTTEYQ